MKENVKSIGLVLAIIIAGVSLPISIGAIINNSKNGTVIVNNYYNNTIIERYNSTIVINNTIIERYNSTIVINNTIIEQYFSNNTVIINNTEYLPINRTIEYFHFNSVPANEFFFNSTFNLTDTTIVVFTVSSFLVGTPPIMWMYKNGGFLGIYQPFTVILGFVWTFGFYEVRFENYNLIQNIDITIELIEAL